MQSTGVSWTWQGTGQHRKEQRLGLRMYRSHFSPPDTALFEDAYSLSVFLQSAWPDTNSRTAPQGYKVYTGWHDPYSSLCSPLEWRYHTPEYSESSYKKPNTSRYAQGVRCADGVSWTQEEHYSIGIYFKASLSSMRCSCCVLLYATKLGGRAGKRTPWGSSSPRTLRTPRVECVLGARIPHEFLRMMVRLESSNGHLVRKKKNRPGWISHLGKGAFFPQISTYNISRIYYFPVDFSLRFLLLVFF